MGYDVKLHMKLSTIGSISLFASFLVPPRVAPVAGILGLVIMGIACVLVTAERYEENVLDRHNRDRRRFE